LPALADVAASLGLDRHRTHRVLRDVLERLAVPARRRCSPT
jgi:hypothetical protein